MQFFLKEDGECRHNYRSIIVVVKNIAKLTISKKIGTVDSVLILSPSDIVCYCCI